MPSPTGDFARPTIKGGYIGTTKEAIALINACLTQNLAPVNFRTNENERHEIICSGNIFVFIDRPNNIQRWRDSLDWSPSRILGNFLLYRQVIKGGRKNLEQKHHEQTLFARGFRSCQSSAPQNLLQGCSSTDLDELPFTFISPYETRVTCARALCASLMNKPDFIPNGLFKKTISIPVGPDKYRIVAYYTVNDVLFGRLVPVSQLLPSDNKKIFHPELLKHHFKLPLAKECQLAPSLCGVLSRYKEAIEKAIEAAIISWNHNQHITGLSIEDSNRNECLVRPLTAIACQNNSSNSRKPDANRVGATDSSLVINDEEDSKNTHEEFFYSIKSKRPFTAEPDAASVSQDNLVMTIKGSSEEAQNGLFTPRKVRRCRFDQRCTTPSASTDENFSLSETLVRGIDEREAGMHEVNSCNPLATTSATKLPNLDTKISCSSLPTAESGSFPTSSTLTSSQREPIEADRSKISIGHDFDCTTSLNPTVCPHEIAEGSREWPNKTFARAPNLNVGPNDQQAVNPIESPAESIYGGIGHANYPYKYQEHVLSISADKNGELITFTNPNYPGPTKSITRTSSQVLILI